MREDVEQMFDEVDKLWLRLAVGYPLFGVLFFSSSMLATSFGWSGWVPFLVSFPALLPWVFQAVRTQRKISSVNKLTRTLTPTTDHAGGR